MASTTIDLTRVRERFPALAREQDGRPVVFADAPGGTQVPQSVVEAMSRYLRESNSNTHGVFATSVETDALIADARLAAADFLGSEPDEIVFGQNATTLLFSISRAIGRTLRPGDELVVTRLDHDANVAPWLALAEDIGATIRHVDFSVEDGTLDLGSLDAALSDRTRIVAFTLASNALGTVTPAEEVVRRARRTDAVVVADAVHVAQHRALDVRALDVDLLACSPYKFFGPHMGVLYGKRQLLAELRPYKVRPSRDTVPERWETGTLAHESLAGLIAAVDYIASLSATPGDERRRTLLAGMEAIRAHESELSVRFLAALPERVRLYGIADPARVEDRTPTFAIRIGDESPEHTATRLAERGIYAWDGDYYALEVMERLGLQSSGGAVRIGFCHYNTAEQVDRVLDALREISAEP
ncbi:MAG: cysteine desulfurase-like protein [Actinomycetota bacterium]